MLRLLQPGTSLADLEVQHAWRALTLSFGLGHTRLVPGWAERMFTPQLRKVPVGKAKSDMY